MRIFLLSISCLMALSASAQKIDFDFQGKTGDARHTETGFLNWPIGSKGIVSDVFPNVNSETGAVNYPKPSLGAMPDGMTITVSNATATASEGLTNGLASVWAKANVESNTLTRLVGDAVSTIQYTSDGDGNPDERKNPEAPSTMRFVIHGLSAGNHSLLAYHNSVEKGRVDQWGATANLKVLVNGEEKASGIQQTVYTGTAQTLDEVGTSFVSFTVSEGQDITVDYVAVPVEGSSNNTVYVCGLVFDAADPNMKVTNMRPINGDLHVDVNGGQATLSWTGSASAASHRVMLGTSEDNLQEVQNSKAESYVASGLSNLNTYYWRVDEIPASGDPVLGEVYSFRVNHLAFPGAEGFGRYAIGGRAGQVIHVTSLEDDGTEGTLRYALETVTGPRTVVFDVSGIISLTKPLIVNEPYVTIAGQTAPGDGILLRGRYFYPANESITRFVRLRLGSVINEDKGTGYSGITLQGRNNAIVDHATVSWVTAESFKAAGNYTSDITVQNTLIAEALTNGTPGEDGFGFGFEAGGESGSFHHNLMAHNYFNNPLISGGNDAALNWIGQEEYYNNVAYNWGSRAASGAASKVNFAGNYYKAGPATPAETGMLSINVPKTGTGTMDYYVNGNVLDVNGTITNDQYTIHRNDKTDDDGNVTEEGYTPNVSAETKAIDNGATYETAAVAYARVLSEAGASLKRDATDKRIVSEVANGTSSMGDKGMVSSVEDSDYDIYENVTRAADFDANGNGIADWYEAATDKTDAAADPDGDGYTNLEDYLNYMATPNAIVAAGSTATFDLGDYFAGMSGASFAVASGKGTVSGTTLSVTPSATDTGFLQTQVTATKGDVSISREFNVYVSGTKATGIQTVSTKANVESFELYNAAGVLVQKGQANGASVDHLNLKGQAGVYILKIKDTEGRERSFSVLKK